MTQRDADALVCDRAIEGTRAVLHHLPGWRAFRAIITPPHPSITTSHGPTLRNDRDLGDGVVTGGIVARKRREGTSMVDSALDVMAALRETVEIESRRSRRLALLCVHGPGGDGHDFAPVVPALRLPGPVRFLAPPA